MPESLLEDESLDLDSRAVAAWLAIKPDGWQISIARLRKQLGRGDRMLGKDKWQRIARELEAAGYLCRERRNGGGGQWQWHIVFSPTPASVTSAVFAGTGRAGSGLPSTGEDGDKDIPLKRNTKRSTTTTTVARGKSDHGPDTFDSASSLFVDGIAEPHREMLIDLFEKANLGVEIAQQIADEFSGRIEAAARGTHSRLSSFSGWVNTLIERHKAGAFTLELGRSIAARRNQAALPQVPPASEPVRARLEIVEANVRRMRECLPGNAR